MKQSSCSDFAKLCTSKVPEEKLVGILKVAESIKNYNFSQDLAIDEKNGVHSLCEKLLLIDFDFLHLLWTNANQNNPNMLEKQTVFFILESITAPLPFIKAQTTETKKTFENILQKTFPFIFNLLYEICVKYDVGEIKLKTAGYKTLSLNGGKREPTERETQSLMNWEDLIVSCSNSICYILESKHVEGVVDNFLIKVCNNVFTLGFLKFLIDLMESKNESKIMKPVFKLLADLFNFLLVKTGTVDNHYKYLQFFTKLLTHKFDENIFCCVEKVLGSIRKEKSLGYNKKHFFFIKTALHKVLSSSESESLRLTSIGISLCISEIFRCDDWVFLESIEGFENIKTFPFEKKPIQQKTGKTETLQSDIKNFPILLSSVVSIETQLEIEKILDPNFKVSGVKKKTRNLRKMLKMFEILLSSVISEKHSFFKNAENMRSFKRLSQNMCKSLCLFMCHSENHPSEFGILKKLFTKTLCRFLFEDKTLVTSYPEFDKVFCKLLRNAQKDFESFSLLLPVLAFDFLFNKNMRNQIMQSEFHITVFLSIEHFLDSFIDQETYSLEDCEDSHLAMEKDDFVNSCCFVINFLSFNEDVYSKADLLENLAFETLQNHLSESSDLIFKNLVSGKTGEKEHFYFDSESYEIILFHFVSLCVSVFFFFDEKVKYSSDFWCTLIKAVFSKYIMSINSSLWKMNFQNITLLLNNSPVFSREISNISWLFQFLKNPQYLNFQKKTKEDFEKLLCAIFFNGDKGIEALNEVFENFEVSVVKKTFPILCSVIPKEFFERLDAEE